MNITLPRAVIEQALEALDWEDCNDDDGYERAKQKAITALRTALEQPQQEHIIDCPRCGHCCPQPEQEPVAIEWRLDGDKSCGYNNWVGHTPFGRILITWKGWKKYNNACVDEFPGEFSAYGSPDEVKAKCEVEFARRLNTTPPQRKPLSDEQRDAIAKQAAENDWHDYEIIDAVEAAHGIKEKNT